MAINKEKIKNIVKKGKTYLPLFLVLIVVFSFFCFNSSFVNFAEADVSGASYVAAGADPVESARIKAEVEKTNFGNGFMNKIVLGLATMVYGIVYALGYFLTYVISWLIEVAQWNDFINLPVVITGWVILRDLCNMFFVLLLLMVAFATILRIDGYDIKKMVPKILIMAVLINFSKTICALIIDASQIVMLTFVSGFSDAGAGNLTKLLGIDHMLELIKTENIKETTNLGLATLAGVLAALGASLVSFVVISVALVVLIVRVVYLWVFVIFSPVAFFASAFPKGKSYSERWWKEFMEQVMAGPILAFFIWLALSTAKSSMEGLTYAFIGKTGEVKNQVSGNLITGFFDNTVFTTYLIVIALLVVGLMETKKVSGAAGSMAGKGMNWINKGKGLATGAAVGVAAWGGKKAWDTTKGAGRVGLAGASFIDRGLGRVIDKATGGTLNLGNKGVFNKTGQALWNLPKNIGGSISNLVSRNRDLNNARRNAVDDPDGTLHHGGKGYKLNSSGFYQEIDDSGAINPVGQMLRNSQGEFVQEMSGARASWHDAWSGANIKADAVAHKAQDEAISKEQKEIADSDMSKGEMLRLLHDSSTSRDKKMALAMTLAIKEGFNTAADVQRAKSVLGSNSILSNKFDDQVDKGQAHLAYDFSNQADVDRFKSRIDSGKIDSTKLDSEAYENGNIIRALQEHHGKDFKRVAETSYKRGKKYERSVGRGLIGLKNDPRNTVQGKNSVASLHARLTGEVGSSFLDSRTNTIDHATMATYYTNAKAADLNKMSRSNLYAMINHNGGAQAGMAYDNIVRNITFAKLKSMHREGGNPELVKEIKEIIMRLDPNGTTAQSIIHDSELSTI